MAQRPPGLAGKPIRQNDLTCAAESTGRLSAIDAPNGGSGSQCSG
jgi:hypothetical protein